MRTFTRSPLTAQAAAYAYRHGVGTQPSPTKAVRFYRSAINARNARERAREEDEEEGER